MQLVKLRTICNEAAAFSEGHDAEPDLIKDVSSCLFIQAVREGLHKKLPNNKPIAAKDHSQKEIDKMEKEMEEALEKDDIQF